MNFSVLKNKNSKALGSYLIGNVFDKAIVFLTIPIFTHLLTTSEYGVVSTYLSWVTIFSVIVSISLGNSIRTAFVEFKSDLNSYFSSIMFLSFMNFCITSLIIVYLANFFAPQIDTILVVFCLIQAFMTSVINAIRIKYMMQLAYIKNSLLITVPNVLVIILSIIFILIIEDNKHMGRIFAYTLVFSLIGFGFLILTFARGKKFIQIDYWKYALKFSLPLVFHGLSIVVMAQSDRIMITTMRSVSESGIYSLVYSLSMIAIVVTVSMESVWIPWFTAKMEIKDKESLNKGVKLYIEIVLVLVIAIMLIAPDILTSMTPQEYWSGKYLIPPIVLASFFIFLYSISVNLEYYSKSTKIIAVNTIIAAVINIVLNYIFIPLYGALGAAFTTVFSYLISFAIHYRAARKIDDELFPFKIYINPITIIIIFVIVSYIIMDFAILRWIISIIGLSIYILISLKKERFSLSKR